MIFITLVAYYPNDRPSSWILPWADYAGGEISSTTLSKAAGVVCSEIGGTTTGLKYYDFRYEDASKMMIIVESGGDNFFKVTIPTSYNTYAVDWSLYKVACNRCSGGHIYLDDALVHSVGNGGIGYGSFSGQFENGIEHTIKVTAHGTGRIGLVLEYAD